MMPSDFRRLYRITQVFLSYGLDELLPDMRLTLPLRIARKGIFWIKNQHPEKPLGMRLRLALQSLGPVWIKFGQMLSTR
ncbi:MAG: ubiquinone biosynthesis regulatory protein kinase UbiB, partial [Plesiomonas sp.]